MIDEIKDRLTIFMLSRELFLDWKPAKSCRSPFRPDHSPSFSVYNDGKLFMEAEVLELRLLEKHDESTFTKP